MKLLRRFGAQAAILVAAGLAVAAFHGSGVRLNLTPSVPVGVYRLTQDPLRHGALVAACLPAELGALGRQRGFLGAGQCPADAAPVLKLIGAVAGDIVDVSGRGIRVNGVHLQPPPLRDRSQRPLGPWRVGRHELEPGQLWLYAPAPRSWDSRFYGPVEVDSVLGTFRQVWIWPGGYNDEPREE